MYSINHHTFPSTPPQHQNIEDSIWLKIEDKILGINEKPSVVILKWWEFEVFEKSLFAGNGAPAVMGNDKIEINLRFRLFNILLLVVPNASDSRHEMYLI